MNDENDKVLYQCNCYPPPWMNYEESKLFDNPGWPRRFPGWGINFNVERFSQQIQITGFLTRVNSCIVLDCASQHLPDPFCPSERPGITERKALEHYRIFPDTTKHYRLLTKISEHFWKLPDMSKHYKTCLKHYWPSNMSVEYWTLQR